MNDSDDWTSLQDAWGAQTGSAIPDLAAMIARARRQRRLSLWTIAAEWGLAALGAAILIDSWPDIRTDGIQLLWWGFFLLVSCVGMVGITWTRIAALGEPAGASLRDWLQLRRRRALLGLRLARITRWTVVAMLPAPLVVLATARHGWAAAWGLAAMTLLLGGSWLWARHKQSRMRAEIAEVNALALEWLGEALGPTGKPTT